MAWGSIIGGLGSALLGGISANNQAKTNAAATQQAIEASLMGFNYLKDNPLVAQAQTQGADAGNLMAGLLGYGGDPRAAEQAFNTFQNSTGYQFRLNEGLGAITGNAAAKGLLNSGATAKGLQSYGQNIASAEFMNYLSQLSGAQATGLGAAYQVGAAGSTGGANSASAAMTGAANANDIYQQGVNNVTAGLGAAVGGATDLYYQ